MFQPQASKISVTVCFPSENFLYGTTDTGATIREFMDPGKAFGDSIMQYYIVHTAQRMDEAGQVQLKT
jgi:hypothetical protein